MRASPIGRPLDRLLLLSTEIIVQTWRSVDNPFKG